MRETVGGESGTRALKSDKMYCGNAPVATKYQVTSAIMRIRAQRNGQRTDPDHAGISYFPSFLPWRNPVMPFNCKKLFEGVHLKQTGENPIEIGSCVCPGAWIYICPWSQSPWLAPCLIAAEYASVWHLLCPCACPSLCYASGQCRKERVCLTAHQ